MKVKKLIKLLKKEKKKHGNLTVKYDLGGRDVSPWNVESYCGDGNCVGKRVEIFIH